MLLAAAGTAVLARPAAARAQADREGEALAGALRVEQASVLACDGVAARGVLDGAAARRLGALRAHDAEHARRLTDAIRDLGGPMPAAPRAAVDALFPQVGAGLDGLDGRASALALLVEVERLSLAVHRTALGVLRDPGRIQLVATILAADATHLAAWRALV